MLPVATAMTSCHLPYHVSYFDCDITIRAWVWAASSEQININHQATRFRSARLIGVTGQDFCFSVPGLFC